MNVPLPLTNGRLSQSCSLYCTGGGNTSLTNAIQSVLSSNDLQANSSIDPVSAVSSIVAMLGASTPLGSVSSLRVNQSREVERIYAVGANAFDPYRMVPKSVQTSLDLRKVVLYDRNGGDALAAFGFNSWNLYYQQSPFIIRQDLDNPDNDRFGEPISIIYLDCWITDLPTHFDLENDTGNLVRQDLKVSCGRILSSVSTWGNTHNTAGSTSAGSSSLQRRGISFT